MAITLLSISDQIKKRELIHAEENILHIVHSLAGENSEFSLGQISALDSSVSNNENLHVQFCNQLVTLITELICLPNYTPSDAFSYSFVANKFAIEWLFSVSLWKNTDSIIDHLKLIVPDKKGRVKIRGKKLVLLMMLITVTSKYRLDWKELFSNNPDLSFLAYIGLVSQQSASLTVEGSNGLNYLLESAGQLPIVKLKNINELPLLAFSYFSCSYATGENKYEYKKWLAQVIKLNAQSVLCNENNEFIARAGLEAVPSKVNSKEKVLVVLESYSTEHAMFRCYNNFLMALAKKYELVALTESDDISSIAFKPFANVIRITDSMAIDENVSLVKKQAPSIIFYPSIGMKLWGIYLSQMRLAPTQLMMVGHPSSSYSDEIDGCLMLGGDFSLEQIQPHFCEKVFLPKDGSKSIIHHASHSSLTPELVNELSAFRKAGGQIRVAINGITLKVSEQVLQVCKNINNKVKNSSVEYVFFSSHSQHSLGFISEKRRIERVIKNFELVSFSDYLAYLKVIAGCDFCLPTLPFGGSNSNIDAMLLNKPKLYIRGDSHLYTRTDFIKWNRVGLDKEFGTDSLNELTIRAAQLCEDESERLNLHNLMRDKQCSNTGLNLRCADNSSNIILELFESAVQDRHDIREVAEA